MVIEAFLIVHHVVLSYEYYETLVVCYFIHIYIHNITMMAFINIKSFLFHMGYIIFFLYRLFVSLYEMLFYINRN